MSAKDESIALLSSTKYFPSLLNIQSTERSSLLKINENEKLKMVHRARSEEESKGLSTCAFWISDRNEK